jgi:hypothetical protein
MFHKVQVPVAYAMVGLIKGMPEGRYQPLQAFMCYWMAFNNIYTTCADQVGRRRELSKHKDGTLKTRSSGSVAVPITKGPQEREELGIAFTFFDDELKHKLITHECTNFFVYRSPRLLGRIIEFDSHGQRVNGVVNVGHSVDARHPVWSPIDIPPYERYMGGEHNADIREVIARQIFDLLYTVRCNTFHGGKRPDDRNDREVLKRANPLLSLIVTYFLAEL